MSTIPPFQTPPVSPLPGGSGDIAAKVKPPAIAVMVATGIGMALGVVAILLNVLGMAAPIATDPAADPGAQFSVVMSGGFGIASAIIGLLIGAFIIYCMTRMMRLEQWGLALAGSILAMIPCLSPCCILGLPFGIWAIVVLTQPDVKAAFR